MNRGEFGLKSAQKLLDCRFYPVVFYDSNGQAMRNDLSLYTMNDLMHPTALVDSRISEPNPGVGESIQGCPKREVGASISLDFVDLLGRGELFKRRFLAGDPRITCGALESSDIGLSRPFLRAPTTTSGVWCKWEAAPSARK